MEKHSSKRNNQLIRLKSNKVTSMEKDLDADMKCETSRDKKLTSSFHDHMKLNQLISKLEQQYDNNIELKKKREEENKNQFTKKRFEKLDTFGTQLKSKLTFKKNTEKLNKKKKKRRNSDEIKGAGYSGMILDHNLKFQPKFKDRNSVLGKQLIKDVSTLLNMKNKVSNIYRENQNLIRRSDNDIKNKTNLENILEEEEKDTSVKEGKKDVFIKSKTDHFKATILKEKLINNNFDKTISSIKKKKKNQPIIFESNDDELANYKESFFVIHHERWFRYFLDFAMFILVIYSIFVTPIYLSFLQDSKTLQMIEINIEFIMLFELFCNCITSFRDEEENIISNVPLILDRYLFSWVLFDLAGSFPFEFLNYYKDDDLVLSICGNIFHVRSTIYKWIKMIRIAKLIKTQTTGRFIQMLGLHQNYTFYRILKMIFLFFVLSHLVCCFFIYVGMTSLDQNNWISNAGFKHTDYIDIYVASLYFNLVTFYSIGYGDITPVNIFEKICIIVIMYAGSMLYSLAISTLSTMFSQNNINYFKYKNKKKVLNQINQEHYIPHMLYRKIKETIKEEYRNDEKERYQFLSSLPSNIMNEMSVLMYENTIRQHKFFKDQPHEFALYVLPLVNFRKITKGEVLLSVGEMIEEVYLVLDGTLSLQLGSTFDNLEIWQLRKNQYFGDLLLQLNEQSPYEVKCRSGIAEILVLRKSCFLQVKNSFGSNMMTILENSLKEFKLIEEINMLHMQLFRFCGNADLVRKKVRQLNMYNFNKGFTPYYDDDIDFQDENRKIFEYDAKEMTKFLTDLDDPKFIAYGKNDDKFTPKIIYREIDSNRKKKRTKKKIEKKKETTPKSGSHHQEKQVEVKLVEEFKNGLEIFSQGDNTFQMLTSDKPSHTEPQSLLHSKTIKPVFEKNPFQRNSFLNINVLNNKNNLFSRNSEVANDKSSNRKDLSAKTSNDITNVKKNSIGKKQRIKKSFSIYYNKIVENMDVCERTDNLKREKDLNEKTLNIINKTKTMKKMKTIRPPSIKEEIKNSKRVSFLNVGNNLEGGRTHKSQLTHQSTDYISIEKVVDIHLGPNLINTKNLLYKVSSKLQAVPVEKLSIQSVNHINFNVSIMNDEKIIEFPDRNTIRINRNSSFANTNTCHKCTKIEREEKIDETKGKMGEESHDKINSTLNNILVVNIKLERIIENLNIFNNNNSGNLRINFQNIEKSDQDHDLNKFNI